MSSTGAEPGARDSMIDLMIMYSVGTGTSVHQNNTSPAIPYYRNTLGLLTGIADILTTILAFIFPGNLIYLAAGVPALKLYGNTLLAALNSRQYIASCGDSNVASNEVSAFGFALPPAGSVSDVYTPQLLRSMRATNNTDAAAVIELKVFARAASPRNGRAAASAVDLEAGARGVGMEKEVA
ncbi:hypothetical protein VTO73DRAFT_9837 [Trametes versicolor]